METIAAAVAGVVVASVVVAGVVLVPTAAESILGLAVLEAMAERRPAARKRLAAASRLRAPLASI